MKINAFCQNVYFGTTNASVQCNNDNDNDDVEVTEENIEKITNTLNALAAMNAPFVDGFECEEDEQNYDEVDLDVSAEMSVLRDPFKAFIKDIRNIPTNTPEENLALVREFQATGSKEAKEKLVNGNLRLAASIARRYKWSGLDDMDLILTGVRGLIKAPEHFDETKGKKYSTYAGDWARAEMAREVISSSKSIKIPSWVVGVLNKVRQAEDRLKADGYSADVESLAREIDMPVGNLKEILINAGNAEVTSLDAPLETGEDSATVGDFVADSSINSAQKSFEKFETKDQIDRLLAHLSPQERDVLIMHYGLYDTVPLTFRQIGDLRGVSYARIEQIEARALDRLKNISGVRSRKYK